jgi:hypothetical protein
MSDYNFTPAERKLMDAFDDDPTLIEWIEGRNRYTNDDDSWYILGWWAYLEDNVKRSDEELSAAAEEQYRVGYLDARDHYESEPSDP